MCRLENDLNIPVPPTLVFDYPTVAAIVDYLLGEDAPPSTMQHSQGLQDKVRRKTAFMHDIQLIKAGDSQDVKIDTEDPSLPCDGISTIPIDRWDYQ